MTTADDIRARFTAACEAMQLRKIHLVADTPDGTCGISIDENGIPYVVGSAVSILGALIVAECMSFEAPSPAEPIMRNLGVDEGWLIWFIELDDNLTPPPEYLGAYNLGREIRAGYVR